MDFNVVTFILRCNFHNKSIREELHLQRNKSTGFRLTHVSVKGYSTHFYCWCTVTVFEGVPKSSSLLLFAPSILTQALEKMEQEWSTVELDVLPYKETGTYILKSPDEASQLLDDHIVMTQSMSFSPFKKTFEGRINTWESKLRLTQVQTGTLTT